MGMKIIRRIELILCPLMFVLSLFVILKLRILPTYGIQLTVNTTGTSMNPTIKEGCLAICDENYPFEDVQVGDIICFKEREPVLYGSSSAVMAFKKAPGYGDPSATPSSESSTEPSSVSSPSGDVENDENTAGEETAEDEENKEIVYTGGITMHRVVEIKDGALITEGDGNGYRDQLPVLPSGFIGKYIFHMNYIGWPLRILTNKWVFAVLGIFMIFLMGLDLVDRIRSLRS